MYDNKDRLPPKIAEDKRAFAIHSCRSTHHDDPKFPVVAPDMQNINGQLKLSDTTDGFRTEYCQAMAKQRISRNTTFRKTCKCQVPGYFYSDVQKHFECILDVPQPPTHKATGKGYLVENQIVRLSVDIRDGDGVIQTVSYIDIAHTPLSAVSRKFRRGFGKALQENAIMINISEHDCRPGVNAGQMAVQGRRSANKREISLYANTTNKFEHLETIAHTYFTKYGFGKWCINLRANLEKLKLDHTNNDVFAKFPWCTLSVCTVDYGNEDHVDGNDNCQGIVIWHESNPPPISKPNENIPGWYFCFPNMEIFMGGKWKKGVAVRLQHGTVITWDAKLIRHCTSMPTFKYKNGKQVSHSHGTYFGVDERVARTLKRKRNKAAETIGE